MGDKMIYKEEVRDLFSVPNDYYFAHCISADFGMGKGIAVEFNKRFDMKNKITNIYVDYLGEWQSNNYIADCKLIDKVFNLITKERYWQKPTYKSITEALIHMKYQCELNNIKKVAMPVIGCGLDKLEWDKVSQIIHDIFGGTEIEILVCKKE